jgi:hypothetical protein
MGVNLRKIFRTIIKSFYAASGIAYPVQRYFRDRLWKGLGRGCVALISFDVDYEKDEKALPAVVDILAQHNAPASFACIGRLVEQHPERYHPMMTNGHEILNHSYNHPDNKELCPDRSWYDLSLDQKAEEVRKAQDAIEACLGIRPKGFRIPHFGNMRGREDKKLYEMLPELGIRYSSSILDFHLRGRDSSVMGQSGVIEVGVTTCPFHPYTAMDSYHILRSKRWIYKKLHQNRGLFDTLDECLDRCIKRGSLFNVYLDPIDVTSEMLNEILKRIREQGIPMATYTDYIESIHLLNHAKN